MWAASTSSRPAGDELQPPEAARTHVPFRAHEEPESMGDDGYLRARNPARDDVSDRTNSTAGLRTGVAGMGVSGNGATGTRRSNSLVSSSEGEAPDDDMDMQYKPGMPIGLLAAIGTPYAKKPLYRSKKCKILCPILGLVTTAVTLLLTVFPVLRAVADHTLKVSVLTVSTSNITNPTNSSFTLTLEGQAHKVGIFPAKLAFERPVVVYWIAPENLTREIQLGEFALDPIGVAAGHGRIKQKTVFKINDEPGFARFTEYLITQEQFTWRLKSVSVQAKAFGFIAANKLNFVKDLTLPGMANMTDVSIADFQLPGDDPAGGITLAVTTRFTNPSAFGVEIGTLIVDLYYQDLYLGPAQTTAPINLTAGVNNIALSGRLVPHTDDPAALAQLGIVFSNYLNGIVTPTQARGVSVTQPNGDSIDWLQKGIEALILNVALVSPTGPISPIKGITIEALSLQYTPQTAYAPLANSSAVSALFGLPFGFSLGITELANSFQIIENGTAVAGVSTPMGQANTTIVTRNAAYTTGNIALDLPLAPLIIGNDYIDHLIFSQFQYDLTTTNGSKFLLGGNTTAVTDTPLGQVTLTDIAFTVPAGLIGLQGLATNPTLILSVDVTGGQQDGLILSIDVGLTNPSNLDLQVGDVTFQLFNNGSFLGTALLPDLHLVRGYQVHPSTSVFQANNNPVALQTLTDFTIGKASQLQISGFNGSTQTDSLTQAFMAISLNATLNGLTQKLLNYANLTVLPTTGVTDDFANAIVALSNPFSASLSITTIQSNITAFGLYVGSIVVDTDFNAAGKSVSISPILAFNLNLYPPDIFTLLRTLAVNAGLGTTQLDGIVALGGYTYVTPNATTLPPITVPGARMAKRDGGALFDDEASIDPSSNVDFEALFANDPAFANQVLGKRSNLQKRNIYDGFDLPSYVLSAFRDLLVDIDLVSTLNIGQFSTQFAYQQLAVPAYTDSTLTLLLPILAKPIVQKLVDAALLNIDTIIIRNPLQTSFGTDLAGSITNSGPFNAVIEFPAGLNVAWNGGVLGNIVMPNVSLVEDVGAQLNLTAQFNVVDLDALTLFTGYLLTQPSFTWQIYGENLTVTALGISVPGISISKNVVLAGMNGFKGLVTVESFNLPSNDPAGGVTLQLQTSLTNPSSVGVELSQIGFMNSFGSTIIGPAGSTAPFTLLPKTTIMLPLAGRLVPQTGNPQGLTDVSNLFNGYIHGVPADLVVHGDYAGPSDVTWLNTGIKQLAIPVVLPAAENLQIISSIQINAMTLMFTEATAYAPLFSTNNTVAAFQLPFAFPVDISQIANTIVAGDPTAGATSRLVKRDTGDFASLAVPLGPAVTDVVARTILLAFENVPFNSMANSIFSSFLQQTTDLSQKTFALHGSANAISSTAIGDLSLQDIAFGVDTSLLGLQGLNARPTTVADLDVYHGYPDYLQINVNANLFNPSNITIGTGDVSFGLVFQGQTIGAADITGLVLVPGVNIVPTQVRYQPTGGASTASGQLLLENFIQGIASDTIIAGNENTTPIGSLQAALGTIQLQTTIPPLQQNLITQANLKFPLDIGTTGIAQATFNLGNPFTASINLVQVDANASYQGIFLGTINITPQPPISAPGKTQITSPVVPFELVTDPKVLITFFETAAAANGVDISLLQGVFAFVLGEASTASSVTSEVNTSPETCAPTGTTKTVENLIIAAVANLKTDLTIVSTDRLDDYQTPLNFVQKGVPTILDDSVVYLAGILGRTIVSNIVLGSELAFTKGFVSQVTDNGFQVALTGSLLNVGPFDALIQFPTGVQVYWMNQYIADIALDDICSAGSTGVPNLQTTGILTIHDLGPFTDFATYLLLNPEFTWTITTNNLRVLALGQIFSNVTLTKDVSFAAFNGLPGVTITNPDFPSDAPDGIALVTQTAIPSPSNLGVVLGTASFIASFEGQEVGPIMATDLTLDPLAITSATLTGTIIKRTSAASTASLGKLFSQFLAGMNQTLDVVGQEVISPAQPNSPVNWLSAAFQKLTLHVVLPGHQYEIISSIKLQDLTVTITSQADAYSVPTENNATNVVYKNPFGFSLTAKQAGGSFYINAQGVDVALLTLPLANAVSAETSTGNNANLVINFKQPEILQSQNTDAFNAFFNAITNTADVPFELHGAANVLAGTNAGDIPISGIPFSVQTDLAGLQSLNARPTVVSNLDVYHGYPTYLQINADATLFNPSTITVITNEVVFGLEFMDQIIGTVQIGDLLLIPGDNLIGTQVHYAPTGGASTVAGMQLLANFIQAVVSNVEIVGTPNTTPYGSLQEALGTISIKTSIPPLMQLLITQASLTFPIDIANNGGIAAAKFNLNNPFTAAINLIDVTANATYQSFYLGQIYAQNINPEIHAPGHTQISAGPLPFTLTDDPKFLIQFLEAAATAQGVDLGILLPEFAYVLGLANTDSPVTTMVNTQAETCAPTGTTKSVQALILAAVANLKTDLSIDTLAALDDYQTELIFKQLNVPTVLDSSVLYLTGILGKTIVSNIVDVATLSFSSGFVSDVTDAGFSVALKGSLLNAGPFDALIEFPAGVNVFFQGTQIANIALPPICSTGGSGVPDLETTGQLTITDEDAFVNFAIYLLANPQFTWTITTDVLRVSALGTIFNNVTLTKDVTFDAFNKLPGVTLSNPDFPGDASNGINLKVESMIPSPSNLGIVLGDVSFVASYEGSVVGPVEGDGLTLAAMTTTPLPLTGVITYRDDTAGVQSLGQVFSNFLQGKDTILQVTGNNVISPAQPNSPVVWLSAAFKTLVLDVTLPGKVYTIITAISIADLEVMIESSAQDYAAGLESKNIETTYTNPFTFSLSAIQAGGNFTINYGGTNAALLQIPVQNTVVPGTSTGQPANLQLAIVTPATLLAIDKTAYGSFFSAITNSLNAIDFVLSGGADVTARTKAGDIPISGIPFSMVPSSFNPGIQGFGGTAMIPATPVVIGSGSGDAFSPTPGGGDFIRITLNTVLSNPAQVSLSTNFVSFQVIYQGVYVGRAYVNPLDLVPGTNTLATEFHYMPTDPSDQQAEALLTQYLETTGDIPLTIVGDSMSSPYLSLQPALSLISLKTSFPGQGIALIHDIVIYLNLVTAFCGSTTPIETRLNDNLMTSITVLSLQGTASQDGTTYATFDYTLKSTFITTAGQNPGPYSEMIPVTLTQGAAGSLPLLANLAAGLDIVIQASTLIDGYLAPTFQYMQKGVPTTAMISSSTGASGTALPTGLSVAQLTSFLASSIVPLLETSPSLLSCIPTALLPSVGGVLTDPLGTVCTVVGGAVGGLPLVGSIVSGLTQILCPSSSTTTTATTTTTTTTTTTNFLPTTAALAGAAGTVATTIADAATTVADAATTVAAVTSTVNSAANVAATTVADVTSSIQSIASDLGVSVKARRSMTPGGSMTAPATPLPSAGSEEMDRFLAFNNQEG